jgi:hypothetical protein
MELTQSSNKLFVGTGIERLLAVLQLKTRLTPLKAHDEAMSLLRLLQLSRPSEPASMWRFFSSGSGMSQLLSQTCLYSLLTGGVYSISHFPSRS